MRLARILSFVFHPVLMPLAGIFILLTFGGWMSLMPAVAKSYIYLVVGITTVALPLTIMLLLKIGKVITSFYLDDPAERRIPLLLVAFLYLAAAFILRKAQAPVIFSVFLNACSMTVLICAMITWRWKISNHMAGIGGLTGMVLAISLEWMLNLQWVAAVLFLVAGWLGFARLREDNHTPAQVYAGYLLGFGVNFLLIRIL
jgi:membrane-associated phospholipid phosphatase